MYQRGARMLPHQMGQKPNYSAIRSRLFQAGQRLSGRLNKAYHEAKEAVDAPTPELLMLMGQVDAYVASRQAVLPEIASDRLTEELRGRLSSLYKEYDIPRNNRMSR